MKSPSQVPRWQVSLAIVVLCLGLATALQLEGLVTKAPRTNGKATTKAAAATVSPASTSLYRVNNTNGATCILIRTDGLLSVQYKNKLNEDREADVYLPDNVDLRGDCDEDYASLSMTFKGFDLKIFFRKTPGGERWYVASMDLTYSSSNPVFEHPDRPKLNVRLSTKPNAPLFATPVGKSYTCDSQTVVMFAQDKNDMSGHLAKLFLRDLKMQSFMYKSSNQWGPTFQCSATGTYRSETAPMAVGTSLAFACLGIVSGYGMWRYFKVKKVQYGTMA